MFEAHVLHLLRRYLGEYVQGLSAEALRISVWKGDVVLKDLQLKAEALNSLKLPVTIKAGFIGTITLQVPWKSLGKEPVIVLVDRIFALAHPAVDGRTLSEVDIEKIFQAKLRQTEETELAIIEAKDSKLRSGNSSNENSWLGSLIATIIGNLKISISNVHIRYEDTVSNPGRPFCSGITLAKLAAVTMDEQGNETFDTSGLLDKLRKSLQLERLAVYHDSDCTPWKLDRNWEDLSPKEWIEIFEDGINNLEVSKWAANRIYMVSPINGVLQYHRLGKQERKDPNIPLEKASLVLSDVSLTVTEDQYCDFIKLLEIFSRYKTYVEVSHLRPGVPVSKDPHAWWRYAAQAGLQLKKMCYRFSWDRVRHFCQLRRCYIQLYASSLQQADGTVSTQLRQIERDLDSKVILLWRLLAHAKVESVKSKEAAQSRRQMKRSWWPFGWRSSSGDTPIVEYSKESHLLEDRLTKEEWLAINKILSYQSDEEMNFPFGKDSQNTIHFLVNISIGQAAARIINIRQTEIICGRFEHLQICTKFCPKSIQCNIKLRFYGLSSPEGSIVQSVINEKKADALSATFVHSPHGENVDWQLSATIAPCHVTVLMASYNRFVDFLNRTHAVSPTVASETATALQLKIEKVTRKAQEQFQFVLEEQSRFALDIDFDAPKLRIPLETNENIPSDGSFILDFGHFTLHSKNHFDEQRQSLYSRFYISGRDIAAFFVTGFESADNRDVNLNQAIFGSQICCLPLPKNVSQFYPLIDRCGTSVIVDQIKVPHPSYPSTRVSFQVPNLGIHFSPARYGRIMELLSILYGTLETNDSADTKDFQTCRVSWHPAELSADARILVWRLNLVHWGGDLTVKMKLHSLKIKDELQGRFSGSIKYLACSVLKDDTVNAHCGSPRGAELSKPMLEDDDNFKDALPEFSMPNLGFNSLNNLEMPSSEFSDPIDIAGCCGTSSPMNSFIFHDSGQVRGKYISGEVFYEAQDSDISDFVSVSLLTRHPGSPKYSGTDMQMNIRMSRLDFFCNRPTLVALIGFGLDLSILNAGLDSASDANATVRTAFTESTQDAESVEATERTFVKGLLGYGKARVVFYLIMDVDSVRIFLNKEDDSPLAMFVQESFRLDLKVHPGSLSIEGTLGNLRLCDMSLGPDHWWGWLCDIRDQGAESLIKFTFQSYNVEDDDYDGYEYSLSGRLSAVRIVFLYRFVQEITSYFMELANPQTEEAIRLVDKVGGVEWLIQKYEIDGATAVKLDLSLDTPIIIVPRNSKSKDFMQLDLGHLQVRNSFSWHGCQEKDPSAVHLDVLHAEIQGINMAVGIDGVLGKPMIRQGQGLQIQVRRSLRDVFRKVPMMSVEVKVGVLHGVINDKEYSVILDCAYMNISEEPQLPPSFRGSSTGPNGSIRLLVDKVNFNSQIFLSRTVTVVTVEVNYALLELCNGIVEESPLAHIALQGLWLSYRTTSLSESDLYVTIPKFSILDIRLDIKPEMRLMLGSSFDAEKLGIYNISGSIGDTKMSYLDDLNGKKIVEGFVADPPSVTMLLLDYRVRAHSQSFVVRIQQPRVLVVLDFLLAVGEFFVPALGSITGREETLNPHNDPMIKNDHIVLSAAYYEQRDDIVYLSHDQQLIVDVFDIDEFTYDGCGGTICLREAFDLKGNPLVGLNPIIFIGCRKKLRFKNVKIENGALLWKYTYLSADSSYSISAEDGVSISLLESISSLKDTGNLECLSKSSNHSSDAPMETGGGLSEIRSITFEAQIVSPEFIFYDSTKRSFDDALHGEKLLRAKMDVSFMFAAKGKDTWVRALIKDLTIEAGSGLVILDPVDISGGYTCLKDKTNISVVSSDIYIRLSLSAISLVLHLQNQAAAALQFGNASPVASCTNFVRVWTSRKGNRTWQGLTIWRPQAPSGYVILGDCVTSGPTTPSQVVMAVSNTYGRVRKPISFQLLGLFSNIQGLEEDATQSEDQSDGDSDCSLWMPIAPLGYCALGCIAQIGSRPPPNHIVYCIRSDLVTSAAFSDCILYVPPDRRFSSGFSIWRLENCLGSFYAHASTECPPKTVLCDLRDILRRSPTQQSNSINIPSLDISMKNNNDIREADQGVTSYGWDMLRSISKSSSYYMSTPHFERIWWDKGSDHRKPVSIWRPLPRPGFSILGDCITEGLEPPTLGLMFKNDTSGLSAKPVQFTRIAHVVGKGIEEAFFWYPISPPGYASMGCIVSRTDAMPCVESLCCLRMDLVNQANISDEAISKGSSSRGSNNWSIWKVKNQASTFLARSDLRKPSSRLAYSIADCVKPKSRQNISAEMKLRCFSLTVLDGLYGMMTPLFDTTVSNLNLVTTGRLEAMNAVLISSIAASTFNSQLEVWEPLVEPFDGIFKYESYESDIHMPSRVGKRVRIAATSTVNLNITAANLETCVGSVVSWRRQVELEEKLMKATEEADNGRGQLDGSTCFALEEDDFRKVIIENKLGCDIYVKKYVQNSKEIESLKHEESTSAWLPPPRFSDRFNFATEMRENHHYVTVHILESKGLTLLDDGNKHDFFCALRLVSASQAMDQQKLFPQSARTRCVKPLISENKSELQGTVRWNELFIFEVPRKGPANLELEVTNLASKAGKGEVIGAFSIQIGTSTIKKLSAVGIMHQGSMREHFVSYSLRRKVQLSSDAEMQECGSLLISISYYERETLGNFQRDLVALNSSERDCGFWIGLSPEGPWTIFRSLLPLSTIPKTLNEDFAVEIVMKKGRKHAVLRSLAAVFNDTDRKLELCICPASIVENHSSGPSSNISGHSAVTEEIFENQRYQPLSGWGNKWPGFLTNDPAHWSNRDFSYSSKDFFEPSLLPPGWQWTSPWVIDKRQFVDADGWAYGSDFQSLIKWPPLSSKSGKRSTLDFVRRRRWVRTRTRLSDQGLASSREVLPFLRPGSSLLLPWKSMTRVTDFCLQVRPYVEASQSPHSWGRTVTIGSSYASGGDQYLLGDEGSSSSKNSGQSIRNSTSTSYFKLNQLEKKDLLLSSIAYNDANQLLWFSVGSDASVIHTELKSPVYDWRITVSAPLKIDNRLPCDAEYAIWEKTKEGNRIERHHGLVSSGNSSFVYSVDVQKAIYITWFAQGGWVLEKEAVLIWDPISFDHVSSFWMVHRSNRRLRVSIERDLGGSTAAPKTMRFFVPYWIRNDSYLPLSYHLVELEYLDADDTDFLLLSKAVKSAKSAMKQPPNSVGAKKSSSRRNVRTLEVIEESSSTQVMLSPLDYINHSAILPFPARNESFLSPKLGVAVSCHQCNYYGPGISLLELENKERIDVKAYSSSGAYYKLSAVLSMASDRTKVIHFQPQTVFINRLGCRLALQQCDFQLVEWIHPNDPPKAFQWQSTSRNELLQLCMDGYKWSTPFSVEIEGMMSVLLKNEMGNSHIFIKVEVRNGMKKSRYQVIFHPASFSSPYRIENRSLYLPIRFRQVDGTDESWRFLSNNAATSFFWEDLGRPRLLEVLVDGSDPLKSDKYNIDENNDHQPMHISGGPLKALRLTVLKEGLTQVVKIGDWMPSNDNLAIVPRNIPGHLSAPSESVSKQTSSESDCEFHVIVELAELGLSLIDHTPEEILYMSVQNLQSSYSTGMGSKTSRFKLRMAGIQVDNQLLLSPMPVLFRPQRTGDQLEHILKLSMTMQSDNSADFYAYPYIGFQGPPNVAFLANIHEPIIWRLHEMVQHVNLSRISSNQTTAVPVDPIIHIGVFNMSEIRFKVSMAMSPSQRPRGVLGFWSSLMTALGNTENMPIRINPRFHEDICMRQSALESTAMSNIQKDLLSQPLQLLSGVDILGNASSALGHMSKGVAALSMDKKFIQSRQRQEGKGSVEDIGDFIREGGGALAKGLFRGVTGILTKPLEGAKSSGVEGFVQGVGKGIIGAAAQPVSGVLDLLSKTTEGANAVRMKIASAITSDEQLLRRRLPRVIGADNVLHPYDEYKAQGQVLLQLAESGMFGQVDLFKVRGKFALSDAYEDHFILPKGKILVITHRRVILLQQPTNILAQKKFNPVRDPCLVLWDVSWDDLVTMVLTTGKKDDQNSSPSHLVLYLRNKLMDSKENIRVIKCNNESKQAAEIYMAIEQAMNTYGPNHSEEVQKRKVRKPYTPGSGSSGSEAGLKEVFGIWNGQEAPAAVPLSFGTLGMAVDKQGPREQEG
ncbi:uncharacterized protein LOC18430003 [Amborella trichopoda]|uniref:uncharacterized protein LOC18430003 n=1 Tax=Amborella trichopoda TaxID=13333 RepID=UPI0009BDAD68|nr:uncharacterized protein LOC18430003 [Amborella trichopoda]|eukprot:XP_020520361.1 uncharacterized protein LOC18430003 [Amborella trichopoda]